jgi:hypothetical protein
VGLLVVQKVVEQVEGALVLDVRELAGLNGALGKNLIVQNILVEPSIDYLIVIR